MKTILDVAKEIGTPIQVVNNDYMNVKEGKVIILNSGKGIRLTMEQLHEMFDMIGGSIIATEPEYLKYSNPTGYKVLAYVANHYNNRELDKECSKLLREYYTIDKELYPVRFRSIANDPDFLLL